MTETTAQTSPTRSTTRGKRPRDSALTKEAILRAATFEFCHNGLGGARVEAIAQRAKANMRLLYAYFGDKNGLYIAVLEDVYTEIRAAEQHGSVNKSFCAVATGQVLRQVPGFQGAPTGFSPLKLRRWFLTLPGVQSRRHQDGDPANNHDVLLRQKDGRIVGYNM